MIDKKVLELIGNELRVIRTEYRMSLEDVNAKTGISITTISNYENAKTQMFLDMILKILNAYDNMTPSIFFKRITTKM